MKKNIALLSLLLFSSCSSVEVINNIKTEAQFSKFRYSYCSVHFCFYSNETTSFFELANMSESIFNYLTQNYSFSNKFVDYPYQFVVYKSSENVKSGEKNVIILSSSFSYSLLPVVYRIVDDIFNGKQEIYPWLYYGFCEYIISNFFPDRKNYYSSILNSYSNLISFKQLLYISPSTFEKNRMNIYYANAFRLIEYLINTYSYHRFSIFVEDLLNSGDIRNASILAFNLDITQLSF